MYKTVPKLFRNCSIFSVFGTKARENCSVLYTFLMYRTGTTYSA